MALSIVSNVASLSAQRNVNNTQKMLQGNIGRLSSGLRINKAGDDAAGLGVSEALKADIRSLSQAQRNANDAISMTQVAEGAMNEMHSIVTRMRELAMQAANGTLGTTERGYLDTEFDQLVTEVGRIAQVTEFNGINLLSGGLNSGATFQVGIHNTSNDRIALSIATTIASALGSGTSANSLLAGGIASANLSTATLAQVALNVFDEAIKDLSTRRSNIGAVQNRLSHTITNLSVAHENLSAANSRIRDVDVAEESASLVRNQILSQAGLSVLGQANQIPGSALSLIG